MLQKSIFLFCILSLKVFSVTWELPAQYFADSDNYGEYDIAVKNNNAVCVFAREGIIYAKISSDGGDTWSSKYIISDTSTKSLLPKVSIEDNYAIAIWKSFEGNWVIKESHFLFSNNDWSSPKSLSESDRYADTPQIVTSNNDVVVVWQTINNDYYKVIKTVLSSSGGENWTSIKTISGEDKNSRNPKLVMNDNGLVVVAWRMMYEYFYIQLTTSLDKGVTWTDVQTVSGQNQDAEEHQIAINDDETIALIWKTIATYDKIQSITSNDKGVSWNDLKTLSRSEKVSKEPQIEIYNNQIIAAWSSLGEGLHYVIETNSSSDGGKNWGDILTLSEDGQSASNPVIAMQDIMSVIIWERLDGQHLRAQGSANSGGTWQKPVTLSEAGGWSFLPKVVLNSEGKGFSIWRRHGNSINTIRKLSFFSN